MNHIFEFPSFDTNSLHFYIFITYAISWIIQLLYFLVFYIRIAFKINQKSATEKKEPVSVIICAQNEAENLKNNLPAILEQNYENFQVIVVNDCSTDNSQDILSEMMTRYPNLYVTRIDKDEKFSHGKKLALTVGIKAAKNEWLLFTDADCKPADKNWIASMASNFTEKTDIVLGYGGSIKSKGLLNRLIRFDNLFIALQYFTFARAGIPYMGVGRNLAYRKSLFFKARGFASHHHIISGDDDLFVNQNASKKKY